MEEEVSNNIEELGDGTSDQPSIHDMKAEKNAENQLTGEESRAEGESSGETEPDVAVVKHRAHVQQIAGVIFDETRLYHELDNDCRRVLVAAAGLHDMPLNFKKKKATRAAKVFVDKHVVEPFDENDYRLLLSVVALQNSPAKRKHIAALGLEPVEQREVLTLSAILRIACGLDESRSQGTNITQAELSKNKMWIVVDGPDAAIDAAAAQHNAWLWEKIGYPRITILESSEAKKELLPYPEPRDRSGIQPDDSMAEAGRKVLLFHFARMLSHEDGARSGEDIEDLHKMRVATRRMRAAFVVFGEAYETQIVKPYLKGLRTTARILGNVRDLDVFLEKAARYIESLPDDQRLGMEPLIQDWETQREQARKELSAYLDSEKYQSFKRKFNIFVNTPGSGARPIPKNLPYAHRVREIAPLLIYARLADVRAYGPFLIDASIELLHALRIEMKKLRYTVEFFNEVLGREAEDVINDMKRMQDHLGDLNDAQVAAQSIQKFIDNWDIEQEQLPISERQNAEAILSYLASRHAELHHLSVEFGEAWAHFSRADFSRNLALSVSIL